MAGENRGSRSRTRLNATPASPTVSSNRPANPLMHQRPSQGRAEALFRGVHLRGDERESQPPDCEPGVRSNHAGVLVARGSVIATPERRFGVQVGRQRFGAAVRERGVGAGRELRVQPRPHAVHHLGLLGTDSPLRFRAASRPAALVQRRLEGERGPRVGDAPLDEELRAEPTGERLCLFVRRVLAGDLRGHAAESDDLAEALHGAEPRDEVLGELRRRIGWCAEDGERHHREACRCVAWQLAGPVRAK